MASPKQILLREMEELGYDGRRFCVDLERTCENRRKRGKTNRKNRYDAYLQWAVLLYKDGVGTGEINSPKYAFPSSVLAYIRHMVPGDIKGEILDDAYQITTMQFCRALKIPELN